jgi:hypothetical protein
LPGHHEIGYAVTQPDSNSTLMIRHIQTQRILALAPWSKLSYESQINSAGPLTATIPVLEGGLTDILQPGRVLIGVLRGDRPMWSGILWKRSLFQEGYMVIRADELLSYWDRRRIRETLIFTQIDQGAILSTLIDYPQRSPYGNLGVSIAGSLSTGKRRDRTYVAADRKTYGESIRQLCGVIDAPDIKSDPLYVNGIWTDRFTVGYPRLGRTVAVSKLAFIVGINCNVVEWEEDAASSATLTDAVGSNTSTVTAPLVAGYEAPFMYAAGWARLEESTSYTDVSVLTTLQEKAKSDQAARSGAVLSIKIEMVDADEDPVLGTYGVGDDARLVVPQSETFPVGFDSTVRIAAIEVEAGGSDKVSITMVPALVDGTSIVPG